MTHSFEDTVLSDIVRREFAPSAIRSHQWHGEVHVIDILLRPVTHILDKSGKEVSLRHIDGRVTVEL